MTDPTRQDKPRRLWSFFGEESGVAMMEFILIAPVLSYLIVAVLFFRNHIDYAMDSVMHARHEEWMKAIPGQATSASGPNSDSSSFFTTSAGAFPPSIPLREGVIAAGLLGADGSTGGVLAAERYFNLFGFGGGQGTPYDALGLKRGNYMDQYIDPLAMQEEPWGDILGNLGRFFGNKIGGGTTVNFDGLSVVGWKDRFPLIVDPWMNQYGEDLDPASNVLMRIVMLELHAMTLFRIPTPRVDTRANIDIGANRPGSSLIFNESSNDTLRLESETSKNTIETIIH